MQTVFSHIVQKRFSRVNEDVATDALAFILQGSDSARNGMMKLLRGLIADLPDLRFRTQHTEGSIRPDMWGFHQTDARVYIENKFWAGLTDNQPVAYLKQLAEYGQSNLLLMIVPEAREHILWREVQRRLKDDVIAASEQDKVSGITYSIKTEIGPVLALTSWSKLLAILDLETTDDPSAKSDLLQLRALCDSADSQAFIPFSLEEMSDHRTSALVLQLSSLVQAATDLAVSEEVMYINRLLPQASWDRIGRYARISGEKGAGAWFGVHFSLWHKYGTTPLWLLFASTDFGRSLEVQKLIEAWSDKHGVQTACEKDEFAIAIEVATGEDKEFVVKMIVNQLTEIARILQPLNLDDIEKSNS